MSTNTLSEPAAQKNIAKLQRAIVDGLEDVKAQDIQVFNTAQLSPLFERVIVASGTSNRQTKALAASVRDAVRAAGFDKPRVEGEDNGEWIIVDCGAAVAHIMQPAIRQYYRLEDLWGETPVRMKLGAAKKTAKPAKVAKVAPPAPKDEAAAQKPVQRSKANAEAADGAASAVEKSTAKKPAAKKAPARAASKTVVKTAARAASKTPAKTAAKTAAQTSVKKAAPKTAKAPSRTTAQAPSKTIVVAPPARKKAAAKAADSKAAASQTAPRKSAGKKAAPPQ